MAATVAELVETLRRGQLLEPAQLAELNNGVLARLGEPTALGEFLRERGWLTSFQLDYLLEGRGRELTLGPYLLLDRLGKGGMGEVYKARQQRLGRVVALKLIRPEYVADTDIVARFQREAKAAAKLQHPNIVTVFDADQAEGRFFIAMEFVEGTDLARRVKRSGPLPVYEACDFIAQAALGLQHAHEQGLIHRDIKPSNLIVTQIGAASDGAGLVKILDFGLARIADELGEGVSLTPTDQWLGTPDFIAPEQVRSSHVVDIRADIFSLGCTFYYLLTGKSPFPGASKMEKLVARLESEVTPVSVFRPQTPPAVNNIVARMLALEPRNRYQTPIEVARALEVWRREGGGARAIPADAGADATVSGARGERTTGLSDQDSGPTPPLSPATPTSQLTPGAPGPNRRRRIALATGAGVCIVLLAAVPFFWPQPPPAPPSGEKSFVNSIGMKLVHVPAGSFLMGAAADEAEHGEDEVPQHRVEVARPFHAGAFEVTQEEYQKVMTVNPSHFAPLGAGAAQLDGAADTGKHPVESVSWDDAIEFCTRLSDRERDAGRKYRLPTEEEWEYLCRAGATTPFHFGRQLSAADANMDGRRPYGGAAPGGARPRTMPVGSFRANAFGLYDMHGNVWEWCQDRYLDYSEKLQPGGPNQKGSGRVVRGGAWFFSGADCRSARRSLRDQDSRSPNVGFRVVCEP